MSAHVPSPPVTGTDWPPTLAVIVFALRSVVICNLERRLLMADGLLLWTCPVCGTRAPGAGVEGLWPPDQWQLVEADSLLARCSFHRLPQREPGWPMSEGHRWGSAGF